MIIEIAAALVLTCTEANQIMDRINITKYPPVYVNELVRELKTAAPSGCVISTDTVSR